MFNISLRRMISHRLRQIIFSRVNYQNDKNFHGMNQLRRDGAVHIAKFYEENLISKKIIKSFDIQKENILLNELPKLNEKLGRYDYRTKITKYFDQNLLIEYANQSFFKSYVGQYFGFDPFLRHISVWLDIPKKNEEKKNSQLFHRDDDDAFLIKTFLCLTDINIGNGPFQLIKSSHKKPWHKTYMDDDEKITMTAKKGDLYLADTNGFHRGMSLKQDYRVLLTAHYVSKYPKKKFLNSVIN